MTTGTKSVLFGAHQFLIHPVVLFIAWWKLYGFPRDPRLWFVFIVHDLGYWGCEHMDDSDGEMHPRWGAELVSKLFDGNHRKLTDVGFHTDEGLWMPEGASLGEWGKFSLLHSRYLAKRYGETPSRLCVADKLAICIEPRWLYLPRVILSGEVKEYMSLDMTKYDAINKKGHTVREWHAAMVLYLLGWIDEHKDGRADTWTPAP